MDSNHDGDRQEPPKSNSCCNKIVQTVSKATTPHLALFNNLFESDGTAVSNIDSNTSKLPASYANALTIPTHYLAKYVKSKVELILMLEIAHGGYQMDALLQLLAEAEYRLMVVKKTRETMVQLALPLPNQPFQLSRREEFIPCIPVLHFAMDQLTHHIEQIHARLEACISNISQNQRTCDHAAEVNSNIARDLIDARGPATLCIQKLTIADIQRALVSRIGSYVLHAREPRDDDMMPWDELIPRIVSIRTKTVMSGYNGISQSSQQIQKSLDSASQSGFHLASPDILNTNTNPALTNASSQLFPSSGSSVSSSILDTKQTADHSLAMPPSSFPSSSSQEVVPPASQPSSVSYSQGTTRGPSNSQDKTRIIPPHSQKPINNLPEQQKEDALDSEMVMSSLDDDVYNRFAESDILPPATTNQKRRREETSLDEITEFPRAQRIRKDSSVHPSKRTTKLPLIPGPLLALETPSLERGDDIPKDDVPDQGDVSAERSERNCTSVTPMELPSFGNKPAAAPASSPSNSASGGSDGGKNTSLIGNVTNNSSESPSILSRNGPPKRLERPVSPLAAPQRRQSTPTVVNLLSSPSSASEIDAPPSQNSIISSSCPDVSFAYPDIPARSLHRKKAPLEFLETEDMPSQIKADGFIMSSTPMVMESAEPEKAEDVIDSICGDETEGVAVIDKDSKAAERQKPSDDGFIDVLPRLEKKPSTLTQSTSAHSPVSELSQVPVSHKVSDEYEMDFEVNFSYHSEFYAQIESSPESTKTEIVKRPTGGTRRKIIPLDSESDCTPSNKSELVVEDSEDMEDSEGRKGSIPFVQLLRRAQSENAAYGRAPSASPPFMNAKRHMSQISEKSSPSPIRNKKTTTQSPSEWTLNEKENQARKLGGSVVPPFQRVRTAPPFGGAVAAESVLLESSSQNSPQSNSSPAGTQSASSGTKGSLDPFADSQHGLNDTIDLGSDAFNNNLSLNAKTLLEKINEDRSVSSTGSPQAYYSCDSGMSTAKR
ncbi:hypothetical protein HDV05_006563 [Chytridiales sp. JEL 0842]|nr:hypothetical protein HDV05_006563 [Chytridiales sp. JEL 0842]